MMRERHESAIIAPNLAGVMSKNQIVPTQGAGVSVCAPVIECDLPNSRCAGGEWLACEMQLSC
jgi:hypothetical protein